MVPSAYLRIFQPLDAFEREEQLHWERYLLEGGSHTATTDRYADRQTVGKLGLLAPAGGEHADIRVVDGRTFVSPWRMRLRVLGAMLSFREAEPIELWDAFVPKRDAKRAARDLRRFRRRDPGSRALLSPESVARPDPLVRAVPRRGTATRDRSRWPPALSYRTTARRAIRRAEYAVMPLRRSELGPISDLIVDLHQWMSAFDPSSILELDYADLCALMSWGELDDDHSAREIGEALDALEKHEYPHAADVYQGVLTHWAEVRSREILN